jgi:hypothetical protein
MKYESKLNKQIDDGINYQIDATPPSYVGNEKLGYTELP